MGASVGITALEVKNPYEVRRRRRQFEAGVVGLDVGKNRKRQHGVVFLMALLARCATLGVSFSE